MSGRHVERILFSAGGGLDGVVLIDRGQRIEVCWDGDRRRFGQGDTMSGRYGDGGNLWQSYRHPS